MTLVLTLDLLIATSQSVFVCYVLCWVLFFIVVWSWWYYSYCYCYYYD